MDIAIQITPTGLTYAQRPLSNTGEDVVGMYVRWPGYGGSHSRRTTAVQQTMLVHKMITQMLLNSAAEQVVLAVEDGTSPFRVDATKAALAQQNCIVSNRMPHPDGAVGLMREWLGQKGDDDARVKALEHLRRRKTQ